MRQRWEHSAKQDMGSLAAALRHVGGHAPLPREQEVELARRARGGDAAARRALALSTLPFVVAVARTFARDARLEDLIQEGCVGLLRALEHFDPGRDVRLTTYAAWWIRASILRFLAHDRSQVRGGTRDVSLDVAYDDEGETPLLDTLEDERPDPAMALLAREQDEEVRAALQRVKRRLGELGWDILQERLTQEEPCTLEELGRRWGLSRDRVRQVELRTRSLLARYLAPFDSDTGTEGEHGTGVSHAA